MMPFDLETLPNERSVSHPLIAELWATLRERDRCITSS